MISITSFNGKTFTIGDKFYRPFNKKTYTITEIRGGVLSLYSNKSTHVLSAEQFCKFIDRGYYTKMPHSGTYIQKEINQINSMYTINNRYGRRGSYTEECNHDWQEFTLFTSSEIYCAKCEIKKKNA